MKIKTQTAVKTIQDLASENPQRSRVSKLESVPEIQSSLSLLGIENSAPELYEIIDAYNSKMVDLSPLNRGLYSSVQTTPSAGEIDSKRKEVMSAYRLLANNYKFLSVAESLPESFETNSVTINNDGISAYDSYLSLFNRLNERIVVETDKEKINLDKKYKFKVNKLKEMRKRGFARQHVPGVESPHSPNWGIPSLSEEKIKIPELKTDYFSEIFRWSPNIAKICSEMSELTEGNHLLAILELDKGSFMYRIKDPTEKIYKNVFGFQPPTNKELLTFLKRIHNIESSNYELKSVSKEQLNYPLKDEVFEIYCAAEDSDLFKKEGNELEFLVLKNDPILNGKILGGLNLPICWWM